MRGYLFLTVLVLVFSTAVTAYQEPNITEVSDNFGETYEVEEVGVLSKAISDKEIKFGENRSIEMCVEEVEHEESAELNYYEGISHPNYRLEEDDPCITRKIPKSSYSDTVSLSIVVQDSNPSRNLTSMTKLEYSNTVDPIENDGGQKTSTEYDYTLIETERKNELEGRVSELNSTVKDQESEIESLESEISDKDEQLENLKQELSELKSGISGTIISIFS